MKSNARQMLERILHAGFAGRSVLVLVIAIIIFGSARPGMAVVYILGSDAGAESSDPRPNSDNAAAIFDAAAGALGTINLIDFELLDLGNFDALEVAPGVTASQSNNDPTIGGIVTEGFATPVGAPTGYNTTAGGEKFLGFVPQVDIGTAILEFVFDTPIQALGAYITGLEESINGDLFVEFDDGQFQSFELVDNQPAGVQFFGLTDPGASIVSMSLVLRNVSGSRDIYGIDDIRYVAVPEPATIMLLGLGAVILRKRK